MTINIPYKIGDTIETNLGTEPIVSMHIYVDENGEVSNIRAYTKKSKYITLERKTETK